MSWQPQLATRAWRVLLCLALLAAPAALRADVFNPAYLQLSEESPGQWAAVWRVPVKGQARLAMDVRFPSSWRVGEPLQNAVIDGYHVQQWRFALAEPAGERLAFEGLQGGVTDVIARIQYASGAEQVERLSPQSEGFEIVAPAGPLQVAVTYFVLGVEHILLGPDHLLFVLALLLIVRGWRQIVATITAFTLAHSVTLVAASLGWLVVPIAPVEAIIALSIVFVASEAVHGLQGRPKLTARMPWVVAFTFGLLHGLGFASALSEIGLPPQAVPVALLMFNVGVEAGQLLFVAAALLLAALVAPRVGGRAPVLRGAMAYGIGAIAAFWTIERIGYGVLGL